MTTRGDKPRQLTGRNVVVLQKVGADWKLTTHIWNYGAESGPVAADRRDSFARESRRNFDRDRPRDRSEGFRGRDAQDDGGRRFSERDRRYGGRDRDEFYPRYRDRYDRGRQDHPDDYWD